MVGRKVSKAIGIACEVSWDEDGRFVCRRFYLQKRK